MSPQNERLLAYLRRHKSITVKEAGLALGIQSLHRRLYELRKAGYKISGYKVDMRNRWGEWTSPKRYYLTR